MKVSHPNDKSLSGHLDSLKVDFGDGNTFIIGQSRSVVKLFRQHAFFTMFAFVVERNWKNFLAG